MSLIQTRAWLKRLYGQCTEEGVSKAPKFARLMKHQPEWSSDEWLLFLYRQGMLPVKKSTEETWTAWQQSSPSRDLKELEQKLKARFEGPDPEIYLFPLDIDNHLLMEVMNGKNGITYPGYVLLFFKQDIPPKEKQALFLHEYHHVCRLHHQRQDGKSATLLEAMIMEGLAEYEVKRMLGREFVSKWMTLYPDQTLLNYWQKGIDVRKNIKGRHNHLPFLFGGSRGYPKWLGYSIGYRMVESYLEKIGSCDPIQLLKTAPETILKHSLFSARHI
ncbi:Uncharacterized protein YjaZ [Evansella caseinilytica]|uniref:Uncharacterized protein YjaZ n=1 Tax=Evansella caseinilytica TaxID=1503961 RepID=A0A1H3PIM8_9BACI|nr:DUF2268 domain-containing putative Zn-dependent protease [Evansella caseinilytica]SDZ00921.1 Uncharacterized protein YjaZ [Evansella caseinilytica]